MSKGLLTVMAGYCAGPSIPRSTQLWVEALRHHRGGLGWARSHARV